MSFIGTLFIFDETEPAKELTDLFFARITVVPFGNNVNTTLSCGPRFICFLISAGIVICPSMQAEILATAIEIKPLRILNTINVLLGLRI